MTDFLQYYRGLEVLESNAVFNGWRDTLPALIQQALHPNRDRRLPGWHQVLQELPKPAQIKTDLNTAAVRIESLEKYSGEQHDRLTELLFTWKPWRKGPFDICDIYIDSEWRSDLKWDRLSDAIEPLQGRRVLDVGCGNGYHCWRMAGAGAEVVLGIDPVLQYLMQYFAVQHFIAANNVFVLPFTLEALPAGLQCFDTVFSMGVLYHRRQPLEHLLQLQRCLKPDGELVLETLIIESDDQSVLVPPGRYAQMKNVHYLPSCAALEHWLANAGFKNIRLIDINITTPEEQRATTWSGDVSLIDFLDPQNTALTIEGHPAPRRAIYLANAQG